MTNGGADKPSGGAAANDNGVGTPGHCRIGFGMHANGHANAHVGGRVGSVVHVNQDEVAGTDLEVARVGALHATLTVNGNGNGTVTIVVSRPNGEMSTATVTMPASGQTIVVPVTIHGVTFDVDVTGGATAAGVTLDTGATSAGGVSTTPGANADHGVAAPSAGAQSAGAQVLGATVTRGLTASTPSAAGAPAAGGPASTGSSSSAGAVTPTSTALPFTGSDDLPLVAMIGATAIASGAGLVRAARRRPTGTA